MFTAEIFDPNTFARVRAQAWKLTRRSMWQPLLNNGGRKVFQRLSAFSCKMRRTVAKNYLCNYRQVSLLAGIDHGNHRGQLQID
jgi:hypothetical protein